MQRLGSIRYLEIFIINLIDLRPYIKEQRKKRKALPRLSISVKAYFGFLRGELLFESFQNRLIL